MNARTVKNSKSQNASSPNYCNTSPAKALNWVEAEMAEVTEVVFRRQVIHFSEPKDHVVSQCKDAKNNDLKNVGADNQNNQFREGYNLPDRAEKPNTRNSQ